MSRFIAVAAYRAGYARGLAEGRAIASVWNENHPPAGKHRARPPFEFYADMRARTGTLEPLPAPETGTLVVRRPRPPVLSVLGGERHDDFTDPENPAPLDAS